MILKPEYGDCFWDFGIKCISVKLLWVFWLFLSRRISCFSGWEVAVCFKPLKLTHIKSYVYYDMLPENWIKHASITVDHFRKSLKCINVQGDSESTSLKVYRKLVKVSFCSRTNEQLFCLVWLPLVIWQTYHLKYISCQTLLSISVT